MNERHYDDKKVSVPISKLMSQDGLTLLRLCLKGLSGIGKFFVKRHKGAMALTDEKMELTEVVYSSLPSLPTLLQPPEQVRTLRGDGYEIRMYRYHTSLLVRTAWLSEKTQRAMDLPTQRILLPACRFTTWRDAYRRSRRDYLDMTEGRTPILPEEDIRPTQPRTAPISKDAADDAPAKPHLPKAKGGVVYQGKLVRFGIEPRTLAGGKRIDQFFIDISMNDLGDGVHRLWGTDLERALRDSGAKPGNSIKVVHVGNVKLPAPSVGHKNIYEITMLDKHRYG